MGPRSIERGKACRWDQACGSTCFNGAAFNRTRKGRSMSKQLESHTASMGPRSIERGKAANVSSVAVVADASMGPRSIERGKDHASRATCQETDRVASGFNGAAFNRTRKGDRLASRSFRDAGRASMGPRSIERGKILLDLKRIPTIQLQWGRVQSNAERIENASPTYQHVLQWGRVQSNAERT